MANLTKNNVNLVDFTALIVQVPGQADQIDQFWTSLSDSDESSVEVKATPNGVNGRVRSGGGYSISVERDVPVTLSGPNYKALRDSGTVFELELQLIHVVGGEPVPIEITKYVGCTVSTFTRTNDAPVTESIEIVAIDRQTTNLLPVA